MAQLFVAVGGRWKNVSDSFSAVAGKWKHNNTVFVADETLWRNTWSGAPEVDWMTWDRSTSAPWTRLVAGYSVTGTWAELWITMLHPNGTPTVLGYHGRQATKGTVAQSGIETAVLTPNSGYTLHIEYISLSGVYGYLEGRSQSTVAPPVATAFWPRAGINHQQGGIEWTSFRDVQDWHSVRNNDGKAWHHGGDYPYIWETGLAANTTYYYQTQCMTGGVWGGMSAQQWFATAPAPYTPGEYHFVCNGNSQTHQSGGSQGTKWQGSENRTWWYHGNGSYWGSTRGNQRTCIYYNMGGYHEYDQVMAAINNGGTVTRTRVYIHRAQEDAGLGGPVQSLVALNGAHFSNPPSNASGNHGGPALAKGQGAWVDVPAHWGIHIFRDSGQYTGWVLGDSSDKNNYMALGKNNYGTGNMLINTA